MKNKNRLISKIIDNSNKAYENTPERKYYDSDSIVTTISNEEILEFARIRREGNDAELEEFGRKLVIGIMEEVKSAFEEKLLQEAIKEAL